MNITTTGGRKSSTTTIPTGNFIPPKYMNIPINKDALLTAETLERMQTITLSDMGNIRLMDRIDSKYVAPVSLLPLLLEEMLPFFSVQVNNGVRMAPYCTQYLDTPDLKMFLMHQNGKLNRQKIRIRSYVDSNLSFLEVKNKTNKGRTSKKRVPVGLSHLDSIGDLKEEKQFLEEHALFDTGILMPSLANDFKRITLVDNDAAGKYAIVKRSDDYRIKTGRPATFRFQGFAEPLSD